MASRRRNPRRRRTRALLTMTVPTSLALSFGLRAVEAISAHDGFFDRRLVGYLSLGLLAVLFGYVTLRVQRWVEPALGVFAAAWMAWIAIAVATGMIQGQ